MTQTCMTRSIINYKLLFECLSVRNIVTVNVISLEILENLESNSELTRITGTSEGGRPNAPKIATTTEYCPSVGFAHASKFFTIS